MITFFQEKPVIFAGNVKNNIIEDANAGVTIEPENPAEMAKAFEKFCELSPQEKMKLQ